MGNTSLRKAIETDDWKTVRDLLKDDDVKRRVRHKKYFIERYMGRSSRSRQNGPSSVKEEVTCLHMLLQRRVPLDVFISLLDIDRSQLQALSQPSQELPLHFALMNPRRAPDTQVFEYLIQAHPPALMARSLSGHTPLHMACYTLQPAWLIRLLVEKEPDSIYIRDVAGRTPWCTIQRKSTDLLHVFYRWKLRKILDPFVLRPVEPQQQNERQSNTQTSDNHEGVRERQTYPIASVTTTQEQAGLCVLCWDGTADCALVPCGHICLCQGCCQTQLGKLDRKKCPVCQSNFTSTLRTYPAGIHNSK